MEIAELKAGRELDAEVAEKVMGWKREEYWLNGQEVEGLFGPGGLREVDQLPSYSTDIAAAAWHVAESFDFWDLTKTVSGEYRAKLRRKVDGKAANYILGEANAPTAPLAICLAALKAVEAAHA